MQIDTETRDALIEILKNPTDEIPTDAQVLQAVGAGTDAMTACWRLRLMGFNPKHSQLALQRATSRGVLEFDLNWKVSAACVPLQAN